MCTIVQIVNSQIKYLQACDPNLTITSCPNRKSKFTIKTNHISTTTRGKFTIFAPLYRSLLVKKYWSKSDPNLTFTSCPNRKSKLNIFKKNHISTTARGKFTIFVPLYRSLIFKNIYKKLSPFWPLLPKSKFDISKNHMSTTRINKFTICTIVQTVNCQKLIYTIF